MPAGLCTANTPCSQKIPLRAGDFQPLSPMEEERETDGGCGDKPEEFAALEELEAQEALEEA